MGIARKKRAQERVGWDFYWIGVRGFDGKLLRILLGRSDLWFLSLILENFETERNARQFCAAPVAFLIFHTAFFEQSPCQFEIRPK